MKLIKNKEIDKFIERSFVRVMKDLSNSGHSILTSDGNYLPSSIAGIIVQHQYGFFKPDKSCESWNRVYDSVVENNAQILIKGDRIGESFNHNIIAKSLAPLYCLN